MVLMFHFWFWVLTKSHCTTLVPSACPLIQTSGNDGLGPAQTIAVKGVDLPRCGIGREDVAEVGPLLIGIAGVESPADGRRRRVQPQGDVDAGGVHMSHQARRDGLLALRVAGAGLPLWGD